MLLHSQPACNYLFSDMNHTCSLQNVSFVNYLRCISVSCSILESGRSFLEDIWILLVLVLMTKSLAERDGTDDLCCFVGNVYASKKMVQNVSS